MVPRDASYRLGPFSPGTFLIEKKEREREMLPLVEPSNLLLSPRGTIMFSAQSRLSKDGETWAHRDQRTQLKAEAPPSLILAN